MSEILLNGHCSGCANRKVCPPHSLNCTRSNILALHQGTKKAEALRFVCLPGFLSSVDDTTLLLLETLNAEASWQHVTLQVLNGSLFSSMSRLHAGAALDRSRQTTPW
jgi:hypothetical protein